MKGKLARVGSNEPLCAAFQEDIAVVTYAMFPVVR